MHLLFYSSMIQVATYIFGALPSNENGNALPDLKITLAFLESVWADIDNVQSPRFHEAASQCEPYLRCFTLERIEGAQTGEIEEKEREWRLGRLTWWLALSGGFGLIFLVTNITFLFFLFVPAGPGGKFKLFFLFRAPSCDLVELL